MNVIKQISQFFNSPKAKVPDRKRATILRTKNELIIYPMSKTTTGIGIATEPVLHLNISETPDKIVEGIFNAFASNQFDLPHPGQSEWKDFDRQYLKSIGFKSHYELHKNSIRVSLEKHDKKLIFTPTINKIAQKTWYDLSSKSTEVLIDATAENIVHVLNVTFESCE